MASDDSSLDGQGASSATSTAASTSTSISKEPPPLDHAPPTSSSSTSPSSTSPATVGAAPKPTSHPPTPPLSHDLPPVAAAATATATAATTAAAIAIPASTSTADSAISATSGTLALGSESAALDPSTAAAHASQSQHHGGYETSDSDMSNHHMLPTTNPHGQPTYHSPVLPPVNASMRSAAASPTSSALQHRSLPLPSSSASFLDGSHAPPNTGIRTTLPSMRMIDAITHPTTATNAAQPNQGLLPSPSPTMTAASPSTAANSNRLYPAILPSNYGLSPETMARYATLPPHITTTTGSSMLPRAPKKEIKRRTKTGCLTCRRRRIKCDETRPHCNNCKKSKRECQGYDPIFRQQLRVVSYTESGTPQQISYAAGQFSDAGRLLLPSPARPVPPAPPPPPPSPCYPEHASIAGGISAYGNATLPVPSPYASSPTFHQPYQPISTTPNLYAPPPPPPSYEPPRRIPSPPAPVTIKREPGSAFHPLSGPAIPPPRVFPSATPAWNSSGPPAPLQTHDGHSIPARAARMKVSDIINTLGPPPPANPQISHSEDTFNEITKVYHEMYAGGLSAFFETTWYYFAENGKMSFPRDANLTENMASFLKMLESTQPHDHPYMAFAGVLETRLVWQLAQTALRAASEKTNNAMRITLPPDGDPIEARNRIQVVEALLSGDYLPLNPLTPPVHDHDTVRARQFDFWYHLGEFVRDRVEPFSTSAIQARDDILARLRHLLDGRENRDILYSIAVVRELAPHFDTNYASTIPQHLDETDPKNRLAVASRFILDEAQVTGGTTNIVRRICDIAARAFVNPGFNIARKA